MILRSAHLLVLGLALGALAITGCDKKAEAEPKAVAEAPAEAKPAEATEPEAKPAEAKPAEAAPTAQAEAQPAAAEASKPPEAAKESGCLYAQPGKDCPHHEMNAETGEPIKLVEGAPAAANCHGVVPSEGAATADGGKHFGSAFTLTEAAPLATFADKATELGDKMIQVSGTIDAVCQKKGCWFVIKDGETTARILMKDYGFTVPIDSKGKAAVIEGTLKVRTFTEAQVKHIEEDSGRDPAKVSGTRQELVLTASGVTIKG